MKPAKIIEFPTADKIVVTYDDASTKTFVTEVVAPAIQTIAVPLNTPIEIVAA